MSILPISRSYHPDVRVDDWEIVVRYVKDTGPENRKDLARRLSAGKAHGADNPRLLRLLFFVDQAKSAFVSQGHDKLGQVVVRDTGPELSV